MQPDDRAQREAMARELERRAAEIREEMAREREERPFESRLEEARCERSPARKVASLNELLDERPTYPFLLEEVEAAEIDLGEHEASQPSRFVHFDAPGVMLPEPESSELGRSTAPPAPCMRRGRPPTRRRGAGRPAGRRRLAARGDPGDGEPSDPNSVRAILARAANRIEEAEGAAESWRASAARWRALCSELLMRVEPGDPVEWERLVDQFTRPGDGKP
jgi:hypothetical protein